MQDIFTLILVSATFVASFLFTMVIAWGIMSLLVGWLIKGSGSVPRVTEEKLP